VEIRGLGAPHLRTNLRIIVRLPANPRFVDHMDPFVLFDVRRLPCSFQPFAQSNDPMGSPTRGKCQRTIFTVPALDKHLGRCSRVGRPLYASQLRGVF
jgi:hypothetical protein